MLEVIEAIDGAICLNVCLISGRSCSTEGALSRASGLGEAQKAMLEVLSGAIASPAT